MSVLRRDLLSRVKLVALQGGVIHERPGHERLARYLCDGGCRRLRHLPDRDGRSREGIQRDIEPRIKALEQGLDTLRGEKKRWVSDKS